MRPEVVEQHVAVGQQVLAARAGDADRVRKDPQRERLAQRRDGVELADGREPADEFLRVGQPAVAQLPQRAGRQIADSRARGASCRGGSASSSRLGGRNGFSYRKLLSPTPVPDWNRCQSVSAACTCS
jgi:hypothetical protein